MTVNKNNRSMAEFKGIRSIKHMVKLVKNEEGKNEDSDGSHTSTDSDP